MIYYVMFVMIRYVMQLRKRIFIMLIHPLKNPITNFSHATSAALLITTALRLFPSVGRSRGIESPCTPHPDASTLLALRCAQQYDAIEAILCISAPARANSANPP